MSPNHCDLIEDNSKLNVLAMRKNRKYETSVMQQVIVQILYPIIHSRKPFKPLKSRSVR